MAAKRAASQQRDFFRYLFWSQKKAGLGKLPTYIEGPPQGGGPDQLPHKAKNISNICFHKIFSEISKKLFKILQICGKVVSIGEMCSNSPLREPALCKI